MLIHSKHKFTLSFLSLVFLCFISLMIKAQGITDKSEANQIIQQHEYVTNEQQQIAQLHQHELTATADLWRQVRIGAYGVTPSLDPDGGQLMNANGERERILHNKYMVPIIGLSFFGVFVLFLLFYWLNGPAKLIHGYSGKMVERWSIKDRWLHWAMAIPCLALILSGVIIALGRHILEPWLASGLWGSIIFLSKTLHDWMGPLFVLFWAICVLKWMPKQIFKGYDIKWFLYAGGYINFGALKGKHPQSGFANAGEKMWFWTLTLFGLLITITGFMLVLPDLNLARNYSIIALLLHSGSAAIIIGFTIVHIWMATALSEGGLESMISGYCDENWATQHHKIWFDEIKKNGTLNYKKE